MITIQEKIADSYPTEQRAPAWHPEAELLRDYGSNSLAFFGLAPENRHFLTPDGAGLVNYRLVGNVAVVVGDPVCSPEAFEQVTRSFLDFCARQKWRVAFYQASSQHLIAYRALHLRAFKMGEEAILHPQTFTLRGSAMANVRTSSRRAEREGVTLHWYEGLPPAAVMQQLEQVSSTWLEHKAGSHAAETSFSTGRLDELMKSAERADEIAHLSVPSYSSHKAIPRFVTGVATTNAGIACAFVTFTPIYGDVTGERIVRGEQSEMLGTNPSLQRHYVSTASPEASMQGEGWGWSLDLMRRVPNAPPGVMELLLVQAMERFRSDGAHAVSLGLVALADTSHEMTAAERKLVRLATDRLHFLENHETLFNFKQKFHPCWESRYLVTNSTLALPKIALAVLRLRNYSEGRVIRLLILLCSFHRGAGAAPLPEREVASQNPFFFHFAPPAAGQNDTAIQRSPAWRSTFWQFFRYCLVGGANTLIDLLMLNALLWRFPTKDALILVVYNSLAYSSGAVMSFFLNKYWTFGHKQRTTTREVVRFAIILALEILYSNGLVWLAGKALQPVITNPTLWGNVSKLVAVASGALLSYTFMRFWIFARGSKDQPNKQKCQVSPPF